MVDERSVKVQEIENCIGSVGDEKHENLSMEPEVISFVIVLVKVDTII